MVEFAPVSEGDVESHLALFKQAFPVSANFSAAYLHWLYFDNSDGHVCGFNAVESGLVVATYVCVPTTLALRGKPMRGLLSLNTATAPSHQGQGLFTKLAAMTYDLGRERGFEAVYGVANQNSIGGFTRKLGFQDVTPLDVRVGLAGSDLVDPAAAEASADFYRSWSPASIRWRASNPKAPLAVYVGSGVVSVKGKTQYSVMGVRTQLRAADQIAPQDPSLPPAPLNLHIGKAPRTAVRRGLSITVPDRFKPSPLRMIYRCLANPADKLDPDRILIRFIDFDAY